MGRLPGYVEIDVKTGAVIRYRYDSHIAAPHTDAAAIREDAIQFMAELHERTGLMPRPCTPELADAILIYLDELPIDLMAPVLTDEAVLSVVAPAIGKLVFPIRYGRLVMPATSSQERAYLAAARQHWASPYGSHSVVTVTRSGYVPSNPMAFKELGLHVAETCEHPSNTQYFNRLCQEAGMDTYTAYAGAISFAVRIAARIGNQAGKDYPL